MIEMLIMMASIEAKFAQERDERWRKSFQAADPEMKKIMLEQREKERLEAIEERRHRENIRAQERIADAIRSASFWRF